MRPLKQLPETYFLQKIWNSNVKIIKGLITMSNAGITCGSNPKAIANQILGQMQSNVIPNWNALKKNFASD